MDNVISRNTKKGEREMEEQNKIPKDSSIIPEYIQCVKCMYCLTIVPAFKYCGHCGHLTYEPIFYK